MTSLTRAAILAVLMGSFVGCGVNQLLSEDIPTSYLDTNVKVENIIFTGGSKIQFRGKVVNAGGQNIEDSFWINVTLYDKNGDTFTSGSRYCPPLQPKESVDMELTFSTSDGPFPDDLTQNYDVPEQGVLLPYPLTWEVSYVGK